MAGGRRHQDIYRLLSDEGLSYAEPEAARVQMLDEVSDYKLREPMGNPEPIARAAPELQLAPIAKSLRSVDLPNTTQETLPGPEADNPGARKPSGDVPGQGERMAERQRRLPGARRAQIAAGVSQMLASLIQLGGAASGRFGMETAGAALSGVAGGVAEGTQARLARETAENRQQAAAEAEASDRLMQEKRHLRQEDFQLAQLGAQEARTDEDRALRQSIFEQTAAQRDDAAVRRATLDAERLDLQGRQVSAYELDNVGEALLGYGYPMRGILLLAERR